MLSALMSQRSLAIWSWRTLWAVFGILLHPAIASRAATALPTPRMTYLDNGNVRIGMDLALGGAVTFISGKDHPGNLINSADLGRQIQMSHYSGPWPYEVGDKKPHPAWVGLGWNPIQTGDCNLNPSEVVEHRNNGKELYIRCLPMQWPLDNVRGDCVFETWTTLEGPLIHMRFRCTNRRTDRTQYRPCPQELPAVYTISKLSRLMSYTGDRPFTGAPLTHVVNDWHKPWPWTRFLATEGWAALVDDDGWGLGVFKADGLSSMAASMGTPGRTTRNTVRPRTWPRSTTRTSTTTSSTSTGPSSWWAGWRRCVVASTRWPTALHRCGGSKTTGNTGPSTTRPTTASRFQGLGPSASANAGLGLKAAAAAGGRKKHRR